MRCNIEFKAKGLCVGLAKQGVACNITSVVPLIHHGQERLNKKSILHRQARICQQRVYTHNRQVSIQGNGPGSGYREHVDQIFQGDLG